ncbi:MAG: fibronectin type III domain-containing protein [Micrococcales bacterium]|nr:fibronectin type III domain-containing protein [Micrococcales bacterium]
MRFRIVAVVAALALPLASAPAAAGEDVTRVLLVGDSVTQGSAGDWTWRYRLWKHLEAAGTPVDFVGPRNDLWDAEQMSPGSQEYVDPAFDTDHAAYWATAYVAQKYAVAELVATYRPEVIVVSYGVNDFFGYWQPAATVLAQAASFVAAARSADPDVDIVLSRIPQTWLTGVPALNEGLPDVATSLDSVRSRVVVTDLPEGVVEYTDTYDPAHLSASGEVKVAAAVADALAGLGVGRPYPRPLPKVPNGPRRPATLTVSAKRSVAHLSWRNPPGATGAYIWMRDVSAGGPWVRLAGPVEKKNTWPAAGLARGHDYEFRLQATKGSAVAEDIFSSTVRITRPPPRVAAVRVISKRRALRLRWWPAWRVGDDVRYLVSWWPDGGRDRLRVRLTDRPRTVLRKLRTGYHYRLRVTAVKNGVAGRGTRATGITLG